LSPAWRPRKQHQPRSKDRGAARASSPMATAPICAMPRAMHASASKVLRSLLPMRHRERPLWAHRASH